MLTVYKYPLSISDYTLVPVSPEARLLTVQLQNGQPQLWALVDPLVESSSITGGSPRRAVHFVGTGRRAPHGIETMQYLGTIQLNGGDLVLHAFA